MERHCCIVPARSGSKSIKDKNLLKLGVDNLVAIALKKAMDSKVFSKVILSTDYQMFKLNLDGFKSNMHTEFRYCMRPAELAADETLMIDVVKHVLADVGGTEKWVWILQPSSPFRTIEEIKKIKSIIETNKYKSLYSVKPQTQFIDRTETWKGDTSWRINQNNFKNKQDLQQQVHRSGNYYVMEREVIENFKENSKLFTWKVQPSYSYVMGEYNPNTWTQEEKDRSTILGTNIDSILDYRAAKDYVRTGDVVL